MRYFLIASSVTLFCLSPSTVSAQNPDPTEDSDCAIALVNGVCEGGPATTLAPVQPSSYDGPVDDSDCVGYLIEDGVCAGGVVPTTQPGTPTQPPTGPTEDTDCPGSYLVEDGVCAPVHDDDVLYSLRLPETGQELTLAAIAGALVLAGGLALRLARR